MFLKLGLTIAAFVAGMGLVYRAYQWFDLRIGPDAAAISPGERIADFLKRLPRTLLDWRFPVRLVWDVLLQARLWREDPWRWAAHFFIAYGFTALFLLHALDGQVTADLFPGYEVTLNPWLALRNVFGALVVLGVLISLWRRRKRPDLPIKSKGADRWALVLLLALMISGFLVEGAKIISSHVFDQMAMDYGGLEDPEELRPLKAYWAQNYGVHFEDLKGPFDEETLEEGAEMNEMNCLGCHSRPQWAFASYGASRIMQPVAGPLNRIRADVWLWYIHLLICMIGLALLPFSKFIHMVTSPLTLLTDRTRPEQGRTPEYLANTRALALDACTHCGLCSEHCSVAPVYRALGNANILPSEKLMGLKALLLGRRLGSKEKHAIQEGSFICTGCYRCTEVCPVGLNLQDLWMASQQDLPGRMLPKPEVWARESGREKLDKSRQEDTGPLKPSGDLAVLLKRSLRGGSFAGCFSCMSCTVGCPVVEKHAQDPRSELDLLPHEIIRSVALGQSDLVLNSRMLWDCMNCYMCQEHCPQGVRVCDIIYELKNVAYARLTSGAEGN